MKILLLVLACLSIPALASASSIELTTYCDGNVEKVRAVMVLTIPGALSAGSAELHALNNEDCNPDFGSCGWFIDGTAEPLGNDEFRFVFEGWLRSCLSVNTPSLRGQVFFYAQDPGQEPRLYLRDFGCYEFGEPIPAIVDNSECHTLPVAHSTWGAVKALYR